MVSSTPPTTPWRGLPPQGPVSYSLIQECEQTNARRGRLHTLHGDIETPVFMPVGTVASVKSLDTEDIHKIGAQIILGNTYHLMLRPGEERVARFGGLRNFMGYEGAVLTDSGGFQVFSLAKLRDISENGVAFRSHINGAKHFLSPERAIEIQTALGSDIAMVLDECPPANAERDYVQRSMQRTTRWAKRCLDARKNTDISLFGIVQGALFEDLRKAHVQELAELPFEGMAIGGVSVGESPEDIERIVDFTAPLMPKHKARYLMGVGKPEDLIRGVAAGVDMFDCVLPTRNARNGHLFTWAGRLNIKNQRHEDSELPIDENCDCVCCKKYSRAYLRHLFVAKELSYFRLASIHNLAFYLGLMKHMREAIEAGNFAPKDLISQVTAKL